MLQLRVPGRELFDETTQTFVQTKDTVLKLEHSLLSISKWESKWCKPFLINSNQKEHTSEEMLDYIRCMTLNSNSISKNVYNALTPQNKKTIQNYMNHPMTATTVRSSKKANKEIITSELIYCWMISYQIPFECEKWHINRLLMLIKVCGAVNNPKKMSKEEILRQNRALNAARKRALHTKG